MVFIDKKKFAKANINKKIEAFMVHVTFLSFNLLMMLINLSKKAQITLLITKEIKIPNKFSDFLDIFLKKKVLVLLKITNLN